MQTQIELARQGIVTEAMQTVADDERIDVRTIRERVASGQIVIPGNPFRKGQKVVGIGRGLRTRSTPPSVPRRTSATSTWR